MRPVVRGDVPKDKSGNDKVYSEYKNARGELINRIGQFCSYCEMKLDAGLAIEHVQPKKPGDVVLSDRELDWDNFLLACTNCNSTKGNEDVVLTEYLWPDKDNTYRALKYSEGGIVSPNKSLSADIQSKAQNTIELTGLDKHPLNTASASDRRWMNRREVWDIAEDSKKDLAECDVPAMRRQIVRTATGHAYWSVWMTVFEDDADMLKRFIDAYSGTDTACFDNNNNYTSIPRAGGQC